jgi:hypothetical protein
MENKTDYLNLMSEIVEKQTIILGPDIAILKARSVPALILDDKGKVTDIKGDMDQALQSLIDQYVELSGLIVKNALGSIFSKYPSIKKVA